MMAILCPQNEFNQSFLKYKRIYQYKNNEKDDDEEKKKENNIFMSGCGIFKAWWVEQCCRSESAIVIVWHFNLPFINKSDCETFNKYCSN